MNRLTLALILSVACSSVAFAGPPRASLTGEAQARKAPARAAGSTAKQADDRFTGVQLGLRSERFDEGGPLTIYVNGGGARLTGGFEDAASDRSSIVASTGLGHVDVPAFSGGPARWQQVMSCVEQQFADFDLVITDARPAAGDYIMVMVGGAPGLLGYGSGVAGIAPFNGSPIPGAVGFAFSEVLGDDPREVCETVAHEIGHTLGLDHTHECSDTMSYLYGCGDKWFQDLAMSCGEWDPRQCSGGAASQNSFAQLAAAVGLRGGGATVVDPPIEQDPWGDWGAPDNDQYGHDGDDWGDSGLWDESAGEGTIEWIEPDDWDGWIDGEWVWVEWVEWVEWDGASGCD